MYRPLDSILACCKIMPTVRYLIVNQSLQSLSTSGYGRIRCNYLKKLGHHIMDHMHARHSCPPPFLTPQKYAASSSSWRPTCDLSLHGCNRMYIYTYIYIPFWNQMQAEQKTTEQASKREASRQARKDAIRGQQAGQHASKQASKQARKEESKPEPTAGGRRGAGTWLFGVWISCLLFSPELQLS